MPASRQPYPPNTLNCAAFLELKVGFHESLCKDNGGYVSSEAYWVNLDLRSDRMAITYEIVKHDILKWGVDSPPSIEDYQVAMPGTVEAITSANISKLLIILNLVDGKNTPQAMSFTEFAFNDLKKYINKVAVVCSSAHRVRMKEILDPLQNQGKEIAFFDSSEVAEDWLTR